MGDIGAVMMGVGVGVGVRARVRVMIRVRVKMRARVQYEGEGQGDNKGPGSGSGSSMRVRVRAQYEGEGGGRARGNYKGGPGNQTATSTVGDLHQGAPQMRDHLYLNICMTISAPFYLLHEQGWARKVSAKYPQNGPLSKKCTR